MKNKYLFVLSFVLLFLVSGCVLPATGHYYFPETSHGSAVGGYCKNSLGPKDTMKIILGEAELLLSAHRSGESVVHVSMQITGNRVSIAEEALNGMSVYNEDNGASLGKVNAVETPIGIGYLYSFDMHAAPSQFIVRLPPIVVDGKSYDDINVHFTYKSGIWATVPNC